MMNDRGARIVARVFRLDGPGWMRLVLAAHPHRRAASRPVRAFTFVEIVMVAFVIAVLAGIGLPRYAEAHTRSRTSAAARRLILDLDYARKRAIATSARHRLRLVSGASSYVIEQSTDGGATWISVPHLDGPHRGSYRVDLGRDPYQVSLATTNVGGPSEVVFNGWGIPNQDASFTIAAGARRRQVNINAASAVFLLDGVASGTGGAVLP
jgi:Tfp pilus assembly protein FimT